MGLFESGILILAVLILLSVSASKAASRVGVPSLLIFLLIGIGAGPHGLGIIPSVSGDLAGKIGVFALVFILFSGGMDTRIEAVKPVLGPSLVLSTAGVIISTVLAGIFARFALGFNFTESLLLGATISSTDVVAVLTVMRSRNVSLKDGLTPLLELESALNDPMTVFLAVALLGLVTARSVSLLGIIPLFFRQMILGALLGWGVGRIAVFVTNRIHLEYDGLYPALSIGWVLLAYALTSTLNGSGFLAAYLCGIVIGNGNVLHKRSLVRFHEGIAWLGQIAMFLTMGVLVDPEGLNRIALAGLVLSGVLILVCRPVSVFLSLVHTRFDWREKIMISWAGLRGAVPIILATFLLVAHIPEASRIFDLVFFVTFVSVLVQAPSIPRVARLLRVSSPLKPAFRFPIEFNPTSNLESRLMELVVSDHSPAIGKTLAELRLPENTLVVLIEHAGKSVLPRGSTQISQGDSLLVLTHSSAANEVDQLFS